MADLDPLIRVRRHAVDEKQKRLAELYGQAEALQAEKADALAQLEEEGKKLNGSDGADYLSYYSAFAERTRQRAKEIDGELESLEQRISIAREDMRMAFADLKKVELTQEERDKEEQAALAKKESELLDEIAIENYRRHMQEEE